MAKDSSRSVTRPVTADSSIPPAFGASTGAATGRKSGFWRKLLGADDKKMKHTKTMSVNLDASRQTGALRAAIPPSSMASPRNSTSPSIAPLASSGVSACRPHTASTSDCQDVAASQSCHGNLERPPSYAPPPFLSLPARYAAYPASAPARLPLPSYGSARSFLATSTAEPALESHVTSASLAQIQAFSEKLDSSLGEDAKSSSWDEFKRSTSSKRLERAEDMTRTQSMHVHSPYLQPTAFQDSLLSLGTSMSGYTCSTLGSTNIAPRPYTDMNSLPRLKRLTTTSSVLSDGLLSDLTSIELSSREPSRDSVAYPHWKSAIQHARSPVLVCKTLSDGGKSVMADLTGLRFASEGDVKAVGAEKLLEEMEVLVCIPDRLGSGASNDSEEEGELMRAVEERLRELMGMPPSDD